MRRRASDIFDNMALDAPSQDFGLKVQSKRSRLSREEVRRRVLDVATSALSETGVTVGLHHLNMEDLIRQVGVPRSSAFAAFGGKEELITEIMVQLLLPEGDQLLGFSPRVMAAVRETLERQAHRMVAADGSIDRDGRAAVLREVVRVALSLNAAEVASSTSWQTYMALSLSSRSLEPERRRRVESALRDAESRFVQMMAGLYAEQLPPLGRTPKPGVTWLLIATAAAAIVEGMVGRRLAGSSVAATPVPGPAIDGGTTPWDPAALTFLGVLDALTDETD